MIFTFLTTGNGDCLPDLFLPLISGRFAFPSAALPASGFVGIISARDFKAPLTDDKDGRNFAGFASLEE